MAAIDPDAVEHIPSEAASTYTKLAAAYGQEYYRSVADLLSGHLQPGDRLLDAGTGPGFLPLLLAERVTAIRIHAFDLTDELVKHGRDEAIRRGVDRRVSFFTADCYDIPVRDRSYSCLLSTGVLHSLDEPGSVLEEFHRVLEPGGTAWVFDPAILDVPDEPDIDLTGHEQEVFDAYGVTTAGDSGSFSIAQAERLIDDSPFPETLAEAGEKGDIRLTLTRGE